jgi:hypothetical protein
MPEEQDSLEEIRFAEVGPAIEIICWIVVVLAPFLRFVNGPAVSDDQWWIQVSLLLTVLVGAMGLRLYHRKARG